MKTVRSERLHIVFAGICNAGKSSLVNAIAGRTLSIVADHPGTTTDPVEKSMEFSELGPVVLVDTAGIDDTSTLGALRTERTRMALQKADILIMVTPGNREPLDCEKHFIDDGIAKNVPVVCVQTFSDKPLNPYKKLWLQKLQEQYVPDGTARGSARGAMLLPHNRTVMVYSVSALCGSGIDELKRGIANLAAYIEKERTPLDGLVKEDDTILLITPIDSAAPKGRLILPEAEVLRDALDKHCTVLTVQPSQLQHAYANLIQKPALIITDSQAFSSVSRILPESQPLTSFSILFARKKGELSWFLDGLLKLEELAELPAINMLAIEACTHNRTHEDIATVKIPAMVQHKSGKPVSVIPIRSLSDKPPCGSFDIAVICGSCMATRTMFKAQMEALKEAGIPVINFGLALAWGSGLIPRVLKPFPEYSMFAAGIAQLQEHTVYTSSR